MTEIDKYFILHKFCNFIINMSSYIMLIYIIIGVEIFSQNFWLTITANYINFTKHTFYGPKASHHCEWLHRSSTVGRISNLFWLWQLDGWDQPWTTKKRGDNKPSRSSWNFMALAQDGSYCSYPSCWLANQLYSVCTR